jgi:hypothetical protein
MVPGEQNRQAYDSPCARAGLSATDGSRKIVQQRGKSGAPHCPLLINIAHLPGD